MGLNGGNLALPEFGIETADGGHRIMPKGGLSILSGLCCYLLLLKFNKFIVIVS